MSWEAEMREHQIGGGADLFDPLKRAIKRTGNKKKDKKIKLKTKALSLLNIEDREKRVARFSNLMSSNDKDPNIEPE